MIPSVSWVPWNGEARTEMSAFARRLERGGMLTDLLMVSAIAALVLLPALGQTRYLANRELRHAEISREMAETHDYIVPHLLGKPHPDKPPDGNGSGGFTPPALAMTLTPRSNTAGNTLSTAPTKSRA